MRAPTTAPIIATLSGGREMPQPIAYSLAGPEKGAPIPVVGCSVCGALALDWETHVAWHDWHDVHDDFGADE